jgi:SAM-dependent methyltransferase
MGLFSFVFPSRGRSVVAELQAGYKPVTRKQPCRLCGSFDAVNIFAVTFWDIETTELVGCTSCRLTQLDPMLSEQAMSKGVYAYYLWQRAHESTASQSKNAARNFRKGYAFAKTLPVSFRPQRILELGPGSGWFLRGVKEVYPQAEFYAWDIVPEVTAAMAAEHQFYPLSGELSDLKVDQPFDLIIARDVIEHLAEAGSSLKKIVSLLGTGGYFHFITPNGHEDLWKFYAARQLGKKLPAELLLNHVNYFDGAGLRSFLETHNLKKSEYYAYDFSAWRTGIGWRISPQLAAGSHGLKSDAIIAQYRKLVDSSKAICQVPRLTWFRKMWYRWKGWHALRLNPQFNFGHEIFGLFRKT